MPTPAETPAPPTTFAEAWALWLGYRTHAARPLRASTLADYESIYRCHLGPALGPTPVADIDGPAIARLTVALATAGLKPKRLSNVLVPLRACLRWHHRIGSLARDPTPWFDPPSKAAEERRILTPLKIEALLGELPPRFRPLVAFAAYTGVRAGELRALMWHDVDLEARTAAITKTYYRSQLQRSTKSGHDRIVPLPPHVAALLGEWRAQCPPSPQNLVFPSHTGGPLDLDTFRARVFRPAAVRAGLPRGTRFHDLRHSSASLYLQSGATLREVMEIHGWRQLATAQRYLHVTGSLVSAAERLGAARDAALGIRDP